MDRLLFLKNSEANTTCNSNASISSELGYETARDDSVCSMYYSMDDDDTVTSIDDDVLNVSGQSGQSQLTVVPATRSNSYHDDAVSSKSSTLTKENNNVASSSYSAIVETGSSMESLITAPIVPIENLAQPIDNSNSDVAFTCTVSVAENSNLSSESIAPLVTSRLSLDQPVDNLSSNVAFAGPVSLAENSNLPSQSTMSSLTNREDLDQLILDSNLNSAFMHAMPVAENILQPLGMMPILPPISEVSTMISNGGVSTIMSTGGASTMTSNVGSSTVQEIYVLAVNTQHQTNGVPRQTRASRSTMVRFQTTELPRRQTIMSRRTLRDTRNEGMDSNKPVASTASSGLVRKSVITTSHICEICKKSFPLRSTLIVHKTSHKTNCKYCDRSFKKSIALSNHLKENCDKIPAAARRKILTNEFNARK